MASEDEARRRAASQSDRFIEAARELGCDENEEAFERVVKRVARQHPAEQRQPPGASGVSSDDGAPVTGADDARKRQGRPRKL